MDPKKKIFRKASSSESSCSSGSSSSDSSSTTSSTSDSRRKKRHYRKRRDSSSSCDKKGVHKKSSHSTKIRKKTSSGHVKKRSISPTVAKAVHKHHLKVKMTSASKKERQRSRTPRRVSPRRESKKERTSERFRPGSSRQRSPEKAAGRSANKESLQPVRRHESRDVVKDKEAADLLTRQRERERKERMRRERSHEEERHKSDRLLPRPSERIRLMNVASRGSPEKISEHDRSRSTSRGRVIREYDRGYEHMEHEEREYMMRSSRENASPFMRDRKMVREDYEMERGYDHREDRRHPAYEERHRREEWEHEDRSRMYERPSQAEPREWDREMPPKRMDEGFKDSRDWGERQWSDQEKWPKDSKDPKEWKQYGDRGWNDQQGPPHKRIDHVSQVLPGHQGPSTHPRRWPHVPPKEGHIEPYRRPIHPHAAPHVAPPPHSIKPSADQAPYKRHPNPYHFTSATYKRFHYNKRHILHPKYNPIRGKLIHSSPQSTHSPTIMTVQKTPTKPAEVLEKKIEASPGRGSAAEATPEIKDENTSLIEGNVEADTTIMEGVQDEDNLSNVSDSDDEILNREEEIAAAQRNAENANKNLDTSREEGQIDDGDDNKDTKDISKIHANKELKKEMDLDFEEISDGELEEELRLKGIGDALGVDWASLAKETCRRVVNQSDEPYDSIKTRWTPHRILWDIGISVNLAGEEFARKTLLEAKEKLLQERLERKLKLKQIKKEEPSEIAGQDNESSEIMAGGVKIKQEPLDIAEEAESIKKEESENEDEKAIESDEDDLLLNTDDDVITHPLASMQVFSRKMKIERKNLIMNATGKYGRALSARQDLKIRRQLCNLPPKEILVDRSCISSQLKQQVHQIFQKMMLNVK